MCTYLLKPSENGLWGGIRPPRPHVGPALTLQHCAAWLALQQAATSLTSACCTVQHDQFGGGSGTVQDKVLGPVHMLVPWVWPSVGDDEGIDVIDWHTHPESQQAPLSLHPLLPPQPFSPQIVLIPGLGDLTWIMSHLPASGRLRLLHRHDALYKRKDSTQPKNTINFRQLMAHNPNLVQPTIENKFRIPKNSLEPGLLYPEMSCRTKIHFFNLTTEACRDTVAHYASGIQSDLGRKNERTAHNYFDTLLADFLWHSRVGKERKCFFLCYFVHQLQILRYKDKRFTSRSPQIPRDHFAH